MAGLSVGCAAWAKSNETPAEGAKDTAKPAAKDAAKGSGKGSAKETAKETTKGTGKDTAKGASKGAAGAPAKDAAKKPAQNAGKDAGKEPAKDPAKNKPKPAAAAPAPKSQPTATGSPPKAAPAPAATATVRPAAPPAAKPIAAPVLAPATRQHAAPRRPVTPAAIAATSSTSQADKDTLESVIELVRKRKAGDATNAAATISDPVARKLAEWIILRSEDNGATVERYRAFLSANPSWPSQTFLRRRLEAAMWDDRRDDSVAWSWFENESPVSAKGRFTLAKAMLARGDRANAERLVREAWRSDPMSEDTENNALDQFGALLTPGDQKARMDTLLYGSENEAALRAAKRLGAGYVALAKARIASVKKAPNARALLEAVPRELHNDPGFLFSKIQLLRREEKFAEAAQLMLSAPKDPNRLYNLDEWWIERRLLARKMIDTEEFRSAYLIARDAALPSRDIYKTEQEFTAGWIALRFLNDPATATQHFARIGVGSVNPTTLARAGYWQGRAAEAAGRQQEARNAYARAAEQSTSYYGQLARAKLGLPQIELNSQPRGRGAERLEIVRAAQLLYELDEREMAVPMLADMGENGDPEALTGLGELTQRYSDARGMLLVGKAALNRGLPFDFYAYPVNGIPQFTPIGPEVERSIVYAIARQESAFNPSVVSPAQAYGLMQVTPDAARYVCKRHGATYDLGRLKNDSAYNATLGSAELGGLLEDYRGSYIMTFAAYNAGRGSVKKWVDRYGDPRDPKVDAVDWVELIPFSETRNYVQRIMENLQVYRARFGGGTRLQIEADLRRGTGSVE
ncbi:lytic transglycosylase domain-containing protein [Bradyrhizobium diazoefficiens]|uniref:Lytic transglycosylase n=2 Tax=Bradyrhizobium diazoefficiens TaxID=1355477 RepID=A0A809X6K2_9BRAD|nr:MULTISPECIES: lytic transglycosylase domain-containing protein [Bradyrhizobium]APO52823.1 lytic transglycosylase [Bradyrhizobium diazoefficiens]KOY08734.1 lytic transglycosylase [Bradyrhizobium diazoefficiens]MCD9297057.1 lytic transglycosylase domain-containing protein [Bradyrhizobium diazoefficiens]MCD9814706.1 lytic transglycosylase domain-containing protein [Bradyrhizobium diazoefficiens]MCD9830900.1 lytic transglycosylase domain-containing protein [Bradyrhizobium diazoefficiens]